MCEQQSRAVISHAGLRMCEALCGRPAYINVDLDAFKLNWQLHKILLHNNGCNKTGTCIIYMYIYRMPTLLREQVHLKCISLHLKHNYNFRNLNMGDFNK